MTNMEGYEIGRGRDDGMERVVEESIGLERLGCRLLHAPTLDTTKIGTSHDGNSFGCT